MAAVDPFGYALVSTERIGYPYSRLFPSQSAVVDKSPSICGTMMYAEPHSGSAIHHHGDQDTIVYAVRGHGALVSDGGKKRQPLEPGDWALIPAFAEHQEINDGEEELEWVIVRAPYGVPIVKNLDGWGGKEVDA